MVVPCPTCLGTGVVDPELCQAKLATGQPCSQFARAFTEPHYLERYAVGQAEEYPANFMQLCQRHGNAARRQVLDKQRAARAVKRRHDALEKRVSEKF